MSDPQVPPEPPLAEPQEAPREHGQDAAQNIHKAKRGRNIALALGLVSFAILVFLVTVVRLGANILDRPL
ncbi:hypothetical protein [Phenylobacterium sp.]|uniref:hypothetical protein n=1 Tax=Phenylobacterium sp. TaxID=1871053 RepID=UPI00351D8E70